MSSMMSICRKKNLILKLFIMLVICLPSIAFTENSLVFDRVNLNFAPQKAYFILRSKEDEKLHIVESHFIKSSLANDSEASEGSYIFYQTIQKQVNSKCVFVTGEGRNIFISEFKAIHKDEDSLINLNFDELELFAEEKNKTLSEAKLKNLELESEVSKLRDDSYLLTHKDSMYLLEERKKSKEAQLSELLTARKRIKEYLKKIALKEKPLQFELRQRELSDHLSQAYDLTKNTKLKEVDRLRIARMKMSVIEQTKGNNLGALRKKLSFLKKKVAMMEKDLGYENQEYDLW